MEVQSNVGKIKLYESPDLCPFCHKSITPDPIFGYKFENNFEVLMSCPDKDCKKAFIGYYHIDRGTAHAHYEGHTSKGMLHEKNFSDKINEISSAFVIIYNQANNAEQLGLTEICGVGYRKALEFLIKQYCIFNNQIDQEKIEKALLGDVIKKYVSDPNIKSVAKRAVWLGNDETHYIRKWEGKNLVDLKKLIDLTVHWIEMEALTKSFEEEMPEK
jgi:hypothetical protein